MAKMLHCAILSIVFAVAYGDEVCEQKIGRNIFYQEPQDCSLPDDLDKEDIFTLSLDLQHFTLNEITVKTSDSYLYVEAKNNKKEDEYGIVSRQYIRRYAYPYGTNSYSVVSKLSSDGFLIITAPIVEVDIDGERIVPITTMGPVCKKGRVPRKPMAGCPGFFN